MQMFSFLSQIRDVLRQGKTSVQAVRKERAICLSELPLRRGERKSRGLPRDLALWRGKKAKIHCSLPT